MTDVMGTGARPPDDGDDRWQLSAYLDGELDAAARAELEARVADSPQWRDELDDVRAARDAVRSLATRDAPAGFWERVTATVAAAPMDEPSESEPDVAEAVAPVVGIDQARDRRQARRRAVAWIAGATAVAAAVGALFVIPGRQAVRPNVTAVAVHHGAMTARDGDPISGLVPLAPRGAR